MLKKKEKNTLRHDIKRVALISSLGVELNEEVHRIEKAIKKLKDLKNKEVNSILSEFLSNENQSNVLKRIRDKMFILIQAETERISDDVEEIEEENDSK